MSLFFIDFFKNECAFRRALMVYTTWAYAVSRNVLSFITFPNQVTIPGLCCFQIVLSFITFPTQGTILKTSSWG